MPLVLCFAAATRLAYLAVYRATDPLYAHLLHDALRYDRWARAIAHGLPWESGPLHQAPLYPYLLGALYGVFGARLVLVYVLQLAAGLATVWLVYRIARRTYGETPARLASALAALYGPFAFHETKLLPAALAVLLAAVVVDRMQVADRSTTPFGWAIAGLAIGLASVNGPPALAFVPLGIAWTFLDRRRAVGDRTLRCACLVAGAALVVLPVTIRNVRAGDAVLISSNGGITFFQGNNPLAEGVFSTPDGFSGSIASQREESRRVAERATGRALRDSEVSRHWFGRGLRFAADDPARFVWLLQRKALFFLGNREQPLEYNPHLDDNPVRYVMPLPFAAILGLAALRIGWGPRFRRDELPVFFGAAVPAIAALAFFVAARYRLPAVPFLLVLAGAGAGELRRRWTASPRSIAAPAVVLATVTLASFLHAPLAAPDLIRLQRAMGLDDLGWAALAAGRTRDAVQHYRAAVSTHPAYVEASIDLAKALHADGGFEEAERVLEDVIERVPTFAEAHFSLGILHYERGRFDAAADSFARALALHPDDAKAGNNLIGAAIRAGDVARARAARDTLRARGLAVDPPLERWLDAPPGSRP